MLKTALIAAFAGVTMAVDAGSIALIKSIAPTSNTCEGAKFPTECATAEQATQPLIDAFAKYKITQPGEQASLLAWMVFESGDFKFKINHYGPTPGGTPGQGTRCMMSPKFVKEFATTLSVPDNSDPAALLTAVLEKGGEYEAASWYYTKYCDDDVKKAVVAGTLDGHKLFMDKCIQTTWTDERQAVWDRTAKAFNLAK